MSKDITERTFENQHLELLRNTENGLIFQKADGNMRPYRLEMVDFTEDQESQKELAQRLFEMTSPELTIHEVDDYTLEYETYTDKGNYSLFHGSGTVIDKDDYVTKVDTHLDEWNNDILDEYWRGDGIDLDRDYLKEIDPHEKITIVTYKGKYFYFFYSIEQEEIYYTYDDEGSADEDVQNISYFREDAHLLDKCVSAVESTKRDLEVRSAISNALGFGEAGGEQTIPKRLIEVIYDEDDWQARNDILDHIDWEAKSLFTSDLVPDAWKSVIDHHIELDTDLTIRLGEGRFRHLKLIKALGEANGLALTRIHPEAFDKTAHWQFKRHDTTFDFTTGELFITKPKDLLTQALKMISKEIDELALACMPYTS